ncbi:MAG TPA: hypothetical protein VJ970_02170 [Flavobacteriaceae bacterium]|nr:hypothetical protein [Flavobacteriaceae bacterium]
MKKIYNNSEEIAKDVKRLRLKRDISIEELKVVKNEFKDSLSVSNWLQSVLSFATKLGAYAFTRKLIK